MIPLVLLVFRSRTRLEKQKTMVKPAFPLPETLNTLGPGLTAQVVHEALKAGEASAASCTENDPLNLAGILRWARTVRALRELLHKDGWKRSNLHGLPAVVSPDGKVAIAVSTGDEGTGTTAEAKTKYPKGRAAEAVVAWNQLVLLGFEDTNQNSSEEAEASPDRITWYLLYNKKEDEIFSEVSLPSTIGSDGKIEALETRYLLPVLCLQDIPPQPANEEPGDVVEISRK